MNQTTRKKWVIRKAHIGDAAALKNCMIAAFEKPSATLGDVPLPPMLADYESEIRDYLVWVVVQENDIIGGLVLDEKPNHLVVGIVAVDPKSQGLGIGKALLDFAAMQAKASGLTELRLATHIALKQNIDFYTRLGWVETKRDDRRVHMSKNLA